MAGFSNFAIRDKVNDKSLPAKIKPVFLVPKSIQTIPKGLRYLQKSNLTNPIGMTQNLSLAERRKCIHLAAPGVLSLRTLFVNVIMVSTGEDNPGHWVLVDTGLKGFAGSIKRVAEENFGEGKAPEAILLTHGHFDHRGNLKELLEIWDVPVYAHPLEMPYLTGVSSYPPADPTVGGGLMSLMSWMYPQGPIDLDGRIKPLPADGHIPFLEDWKWLHTPGHAPGHVSFWREYDRTLIAGDAFVTTKMESASCVAMQTMEVSRPPAFLNYDWQAAKESVEKLAALKPLAVASGHGVPMMGEEMITQLEELSEQFDEIALPSHGRYVHEPAVADENGVQELPPPVIPRALLIGAGIAVMAITAGIIWRRRMRYSEEA
jgi:glyoxylase-like metal-dependent hydrolase (beta-lactamase superfamily II)